MKIKNPFKLGEKKTELKHLPDGNVNKSNNTKSGDSLLIDPRKLDPLQQVSIDVDTVRILTNDGNTNRLSKLTKDEMDEIYELEMFNRIFMESSDIGILAVKTRLDMFCSVNGWNIEQVTNTLKNEQNINMQGQQ